MVRRLPTTPEEWLLALVVTVFVALPLVAVLTLRQRPKMRALAEGLPRHGFRIAGGPDLAWRGERGFLWEVRGAWRGAAARVAYSGESRGMTTVVGLAAPGVPPFRALARDRARDGVPEAAAAVLARAGVRGVSAHGGWIEISRWTHVTDAGVVAADLDALSPIAADFERSRWGERK